MFTISHFIGPRTSTGWLEFGHRYATRESAERAMVRQIEDERAAEITSWWMRVVEISE